MALPLPYDVANRVIMDPLALTPPQNWCVAVCGCVWVCVCVWGGQEVDGWAVSGGTVRVLSQVSDGCRGR